LAAWKLQEILRLFVNLAVEGYCINPICISLLRKSADQCNRKQYNKEIGYLNLFRFIAGCGYSG
jgi:hypothetical protein